MWSNFVQLFGSVPWSQLFEYAVLAVLLKLGDTISGPLGGSVNLLVSFLLRLPVLGWVFGRLLRSPLHLAAVTKPLAWVISSSGLVIGLLVHNLLWGVPNNQIEYWIILVMAALAILEIIDDLLLFEDNYVYIDSITRSMQSMPFFGFSSGMMLQMVLNGNKTHFRSLARATFVDQTLTTFFRLLVTIGIVYFSMGQLGHLALAAGSTSSSMWESVLLSFSLIDVTGSVNVPYTGMVWGVARTVSAFVAFFWLVIYLGLQASSVDSIADETYDRLRNEYLANLQKHFENAQQESTPEQDGNSSEPELDSQSTDSGGNAEVEGQPK